MEAEIQEELQYIKPNNEVYQMNQRAKVQPVRRVPLWLLIPLLALTILGGYVVFMNVGAETVGQTTYKVEGDIDYQVYLKDNDYYSEKYLESGKQYIASLIDTVRADFKYQLDVDPDVSAHYEYEIVAETKATDRSDKNKVLYEQSETLVTGKIQDIQGSEFKISEAVNVDYAHYNEIMRNFRSDFGISANCFLDLKLIVKVDGAIKTEDTLVMNIPLSDQTLDISINTKAINREENLGLAKTEVYVKDLPMLIIGSILAVASVTAGIIVVILYKTRYGDNWYAEALDTILKRYDTNIVNVSGIFYEPENTERVSEFIELLDVANGENAMIQFCEVIPDYKAYFVVKGANTAYRYTLSREYQDELRRTGQGKERF